MFINIGFGNFINSDQIISISRSDSAPMKRLVQCARDQGTAVDATQGRKTKSVLMTNGGYVVLSALLPETVAGRFRDETVSAPEEEKGEEEDA